MERGKVAGNKVKKDRKRVRKGGGGNYVKRQRRGR